MSDDDLLIEKMMFGWWFDVIFKPRELTKDSRFKLVRIAGWFASFLWFFVLVPVTVVLMIVLGAIDAWRSV